jgi:hypothetical protein
MISKKPIRAAWFSICRLLESHPIAPRLTRFMFWRLLQAYGFVGFKDGKKVLAVKIA